jgi:cytochrome c oxidase subunit 3
LAPPSLADPAAAPIDDHAHGHDPDLAHHFDDLTQQREAGELGMWLFLVTEFMFFGGLFMAYLVYRYWYPAQFAEGSAHMRVGLGTFNTAVLLTSSLTMALAVHAATVRSKAMLILMLLATILFGGIFLGVKAFEYHEKYVDGHIPFAGLPFGTVEGEHKWIDQQDRPGVATFYNLYFLMTGLHAFHMVIGMVLMGVLIYMAMKDRLFGARSILVYNSGLYWHFVDLVWVYLFPFFYLIAPHGIFSGGGH